MRAGVSETRARDSLGGYTGAWNAFVAFCGSRTPPLCPLSATPTTVALFLLFRLSSVDGGAEVLGDQNRLGDDPLGTRREPVGQPDRPPTP